MVLVILIGGMWRAHSRIGAMQQGQEPEQYARPLLFALYRIAISR